MATITKFKIEPADSEDLTFAVTKKRIQTHTTTVTNEMDENGNIISGRHGSLDSSSVVSIDEEITAIGIPSKKEAKVIILETSDTKKEEEKREEEYKRPRPINLSKIIQLERDQTRGASSINLTKLMNPSVNGKDLNGEN